MSKLFQIYEDDLADLERVLPEIIESLAVHLTPRIRTQVSRVQTILMNVRWNYGPPTNVKRISADEPPEDD